MKIGVDLDDTLGHFVPAFIEFHNEKYGTNLKLEDFKSFDLQAILGTTESEEQKRVHEFHESPYNENMKPLEGSLEILEKLKKENELFIITARQDMIKKETEKWVGENFPNIFSKIYFTNHGKTTKRKICDDFDMDIFIEDNLKYAFECSEPNRKIYLIDSPWNQTDKLPEGVTRVHSWKEIGELI